MANNLMTPAEVVSLAINDTAFDANLIKAEYIEAAQLGSVKALLGATFYDLVVATPASYTALLVYIKNVLAYETLVIALPFIHVHLVSQGLQVNYSDYGNNATDAQRADLSKSARIMSDIYRTELLRYLADNTATYTDWDNEILYKHKGGFILY